MSRIGSGSSDWGGEVGTFGVEEGCRNWVMSLSVVDAGKECCQMRRLLWWLMDDDERGKEFRVGIRSDVPGQ